ncbi:MAG: hypothetical protein JWO19_4490 [Bryobacterales bacterium]|nr:hypothetical protein [Bryobacterales bacterium]
MARKRREFASMTEMLEFFKKTGAQGGKARAAKMTAKQRSAAASKAVKARWKKAASGSSKAKAKKAAK